MLKGGLTTESVRRQVAVCETSGDEKTFNQNHLPVSREGEEEEKGAKRSDSMKIKQ